MKFLPKGRDMCCQNLCNSEIQKQKRKLTDNFKVSAFVLEQFI